MNTQKKEAELLDLQLLATIIYIGSLIISIYLTYNDKLTVLNLKKIFTDKQNRNLSIFNRLLVVILTLTFLYASYETRKLAKIKGEKLENFNLQVIASEISLISTLIVLYVVIKSQGEQYSIISGISNPNL